MSYSHPCGRLWFSIVLYPEVGVPECCLMAMESCAAFNIQLIISFAMKLERVAKFESTSCVITNGLLTLRSGRLNMLTSKDQEKGPTGQGSMTEGSSAYG